MERTEATTARADALRALTDDHRKTLVADTRLRAPGTSYEPGDLLNGAYERWLASEKPIVGPSETCTFLRGAIRSIASNDHRHAATVRRMDGERIVAVDGQPDPLEAVPDRTASPEAAIFLAQLYELCAVDPDVQALIMYQDDGAERADVLKELGWDVTKYETVQKRKKRMIARLIIEEKL